MKYLIALLILFTSCNSINKQHSHPAVKNGDVSINYTIKGEADTVIVFVHGWAINKTYWQSQQDLLSSRFTTVAIDLGGHGTSAHKRNSWTMYNYADDVIAVINTLKLDKVILVGHSMSGDVVTAVADSIPGKIIGLIGVDNFKGTIDAYSKEDLEQYNAFFAAMHANYNSAVTRFGYATLFPPRYTDSAIMKKVISDILATDTSISIKTMEAIMQSELTTKERLSKLTIPVHVITSEYAPTNKTQMNAVCKAGFKEKIITGVGHYPMVEQPNEFNRLLMETINDISKEH